MNNETVSSEELFDVLRRKLEALKAPPILMTVIALYGDKRVDEVLFGPLAEPSIQRIST